MRAALAALAVLGAFSGPTLTAQAPQPKTSSSYSAYVRVIDNHKRAVPQVSSADLQLRINGAKATILRVAPVQDPLTVAVLVDHCTRAVVDVRTALDAFVRALAPAHRVGVVTVGGAPALLVPFTNDTEVLSQGVGGLGRIGCTGLHVIDGIREAYRSAEIRKAGRGAVVAIVGHKTDASPENVAPLMAEVMASGKPLFTVRYEGDPDAGMNEASNLTSLLSNGPTDSGGTTFALLNAAGLRSTLASLASILSSELLVEFSLERAPAPNQPLEIQARTRKRGDRVLVSRVMENVHIRSGPSRKAALRRPRRIR